MTVIQAPKQIAKKKNLTCFVYLLAAIKFIFPFLLQNAIYEPHRDEFLYLAEGHHLAWGYLEVPPVLSFFGWLTNMLGGSIFWIRIWPSLFGSFTYILVARLILLFDGRRFALLLGFLPFVLGYFVHVHFMLQPNFLDMFFWTLMAYGLVCYIKTGLPKWLYVAGIGLGLGLMSKYSVSFFATGLLIGLLFTKERKLLLNKHFYFAMLLAFTIFSPNLLWQWSHGFPFINQAKELQQQQLQKLSQAEFLRDQLLFNLPCIVIWFSGLYWLIFKVEGKPYRFVAVAVAVAFAILLAGHGKGYYVMAAYPILFAFGAVYLERLTYGTYIYWRYVILSFALIVGCFMDTVMLPFLPPQQLATWYSNNAIFGKMGFLMWEDRKNHPLPQDFADMLGWKEMTLKVAHVYHGFDDTTKIKTAIDCDNYGEGGAIDYYGRAENLASPFGHAASYLFWTPLSVFQTNDNFIMVSDYRAEIHEDFIKEFKSAKLVDSVTNPYAREFGSYIILLQQPSQKFRKDWQAYYETLQQKTSSYHK